MDVLLPSLIIIPTTLFIALLSLKFVNMSWEIAESSPDPGGLPGRYLIKTFVPLGFFLITIQGVAMTLYSLIQLKKSAQAKHE